MLATNDGDNDVSSTSASPRSLIDAWTKEQLHYASIAVFEDAGLSFSVSACRIVDTEDYSQPAARTVSGSISGLHCIGGLDVSFPRQLKDEGVATLTVMEFPSLKVRRSGRQRDPSLHSVTDLCSFYTP